MSNGCHVLALEAQNFLGLRAIRLELDEKGLVVSGPNGAGKSSALKILEACLCGKPGEPLVPVRVGAFSAKIKTVLGRRGEPLYIVTKEWVDGKPSTLVVTTADGRLEAPQKILSGLLCALSINLDEFFNPPGTPAAQAKRQTELLLEACPVDVDLLDLEFKRKTADEERAAAKKVGEKLAAQLRNLPGEVPVPAKVDVDSLRLEIAAEREKERALADADSRWQRARAAHETAVQRVAELERQLEAARNNERATLAAMQETEGAKGALPPPKDTRPLEEKLSKAIESNQRRVGVEAANKDFEEKMGDLQECRAMELAATERRDALVQTRLDALARAKFPYPGLGIDEQFGVTLTTPAGTLPFAQLNTALRIEIAFVVLAALNPGLHVAFVRDGDKLDPATISNLFEVAAALDFQILMERVVADQPGCVVFRDGALETKEEGAA